MEPLTLFKDFKERKLFFIIAFLVFLLNLYLEFYQFKKFKKNEVYHTHGIIQNVYTKNKYTILKIKTDNFTFFTKYSKNNQFTLFNEIELFVVSKDTTFLSYLQNFYANSFALNIIIKETSNRERIFHYITNQHLNNNIGSMYSALILATPITNYIREFSSNIGISHLIAISGFHLGVISFVLYFIIYLLYNKLHQYYFPYRNKKFDIMVFISFLLLVYMIFIDIPPSLLRALIMFIFALFLLRNNIKIISFETLLLISILIIALFPKLLFSLSLWFSIAGVFYIFLFIKYFSHLNKPLQFVLFNFWLYLSINPITHYFFPTTALEQLYSPLLTILFSFFYPLSILLHLINSGNVFDYYLENLINMNIYSIEVSTPNWFFIFYIVVSLFSITRKKIFIVLNILLILYNIWLFHFIF